MWWTSGPPPVASEARQTGVSEGKEGGRARVGAHLGKCRQRGGRPALGWVLEDVRGQAVDNDEDEFLVAARVRRPA